MRFALLAVGLWACLGLGGCYYGHLAKGQLRLMWRRQPIEDVLAAPDTPPDVRALLARVEDVRDFAKDLGLDVGGQYTSYVDWPGDRVVTTLVRTRAGSLEAVPWRYPFLGALPYKGYFEQHRAEAEADRLRGDDYQVCVSGVSAYSTLGFVDDPVTQPMLARGAASLVETLFHELVHATAFVAGDADFNEGVAQFIGQQAALRYFAANPPGPELPDDWPDVARVRDGIADRARIAARTLDFRESLAALEGEPDRARRRADAEAALRAELAAMPLAAYDPTRVAERTRLSDPCLALRGAYVRDGPRHATVLEALGGDLRAMIRRLVRWADEGRDVEAFFDVEEFHEADGASELRPEERG
ncbi:MAG: aminopeptidase [Myxococcota bacterium]